MRVAHRFSSAALLGALILGSSTVSHPQVLDPVVIYPSDVTTLGGLFSRIASSSGAGGYKLTTPDTGWENLAAAAAQPAHYFEAEFDASAATPYHVWLRMRAWANSKFNESVWVQFDRAVGADGSPLWRIGTTSALLVNLEDCSACGVSGWGWQDNAWWLGQSAVVRFAAAGRQRIRVQLREDGVDIDQIVLSASTFATTAPGALRNDATIVPRTVIPTGPRLTRQPYLQQVMPTGAIVAFVTAQPGTAAVRVAQGSTAPRVIPAVTTVVSAEVNSGAVSYLHVARITGLTPSTTYAYDPLIGGVDLTSGTDQLTTAPVPGTGPVRFLAFGDSGVGSPAQRQLAARMTGEGFDFAIHTGDLAYGDSGSFGPGTMPRLEEWFFDIYRDWLRRRPIYPAIGNHDDEAQQGLPFRTAFVLPETAATPSYPDHAERYYSFDYGPAHIVILDTERAFQDVARRQVQMEWLVRDLAASRQPWKVAVMHRSPYSAGGEHGSDVAVRAAFEPLLAAGGVSLVLSGHEHDYERTLPQGRAAGGLGITYIVTGGGGARLYPASVAPWTAASASAHHYVRGTIDACRLSIEAIGLDGQAIDQWSLVQCGAGPQPYLGRPAVVPGTVQAEAFDDGGEGVAFHDLSPANEGGQFRTSAVDIERTIDPGGGFNVGWIFPGEWLIYTVSVSAPVTVDVYARVASPGIGGTFSVSVDGVTAPGLVQIPATGGWQIWRTVRGPRLSLTSGLHQIRLDMRSVSSPGAAVGNLNSVTLQAVP